VAYDSLNPAGATSQLPRTFLHKGTPPVNRGKVVYRYPRVAQVLAQSMKIPRCMQRFDETMG